MNAAKDTQEGNANRNMEIDNDNADEENNDENDEDDNNETQQVTQTSKMAFENLKTAAKP